MDALRAGQCKVETVLRIRDRVGARRSPWGALLVAVIPTRRGLRLRPARLAQEAEGAGHPSDVVVSAAWRRCVLCGPLSSFAADLQRSDIQRGSHCSAATSRSRECQRRSWTTIK